MKGKVSTKLGFELPEAEEDLFKLDGFPLFDFLSAMRTVGDETILKDLLHLMVEQSIPEDAALIQDAYIEKDWNEVQHLAHKMKSGALYCGTIRMQYACQYLERYRKAGHKDALEKLYHQLIMVLHETSYYIKLWLADHRS